MKIVYTLLNSRWYLWWIKFRLRCQLTALTGFRKCYINAIWGKYG